MAASGEAAGSDGRAQKIIVLINPNSNAEATRSMAEIARRETDGVAQIEERSNEARRPS